jgi:tRNA(fMet)-specific endonuclease VapC
MFLLDTDHISLDQRGHPEVRARLQRTATDMVAVSAITVEEQVRGWLAVVSAANTAQRRADAYLRLTLAVEYLASITILAYTVEADSLVNTMRKQGARIGTADLRIAATALVHGATLVTRNSKDFGRVPGLRIVDWSLPEPYQ